MYEFNGKEYLIGAFGALLVCCVWVIGLFSGVVFIDEDVVAGVCVVNVDVDVGIIGIFVVYHILHLDYSYLLFLIFLYALCYLVC